MTIAAKQVAELRKLTDCGMMDCKKALEEASGDIDKAIEILRTKGIAKAAKKSARITAEGKITASVSSDQKMGVILEVNSETDFVARDENFAEFVDKITEIALNEQISDINELLSCKLDGKSVEEKRQELITKIGENVNIRRIARMETSGILGHYVHGFKIGVLVAVEEGDEILAKDLAMHIAASKPHVVKPEDVDAALVAKEKELYKAQAKESGKPEHIIKKMVEGRIQKFLNEISLVGQPFVKDPDQTVGSLLKSKNANIDTFIRFELGEGVEKKEGDFAKEVKAQIDQAH